MRLLRAIVVISVAALSIISCVAREIPPPPKPTRVALVLGAGASRGFAHIGVLKVLESNRIPVHMIVGTSAGSFVGCVYAFGYSAYQLQRMAIGLDKSDIVDLAIPDNGFIKGEKLENYVNQLVSNTPLERLRIPFYAVATDIRRGEEVVFGMGNTGTAVRASCSIPGVFRPVSISGATYVDGGVVSPIAVEAARKYGADVVIAVDISAGIGNSVPQTTIETILQSIDIMHSKISSAQLLKADVVITPRVGHIGSADFSKRHEAILEGERAANEALPRIQSILNTFRSQGRL
ncbi:MAG TPA: patatin-like phospholipase family protein [Syntrophales bacterium]|nr:patatin-like phospholipase family protein [Syntrophobacterales bacterium]HRT70202.1 patatin-like phospholipase family protein [Syntrophales bacterium]